MNHLRLNVALLRQRVPNLTVAASTVGLRPATVSNLCTGKIPIGRAEVRTLAALAELADCSLDELVLRGSDVEMIETGIKVIDLFSPITRGGTIGFVARPGMGQLVVLAEIFHRMNLKGYPTILLMPRDEGLGIEEVINESKIVCKTIDEAYELITQMGEKETIFLAADRQMVLTGEIYSLIEKLQESGVTNLTTCLVDLRGEAVDVQEPYGPLDTLLQFDAELISRRIYPAINPVYSTSILVEGANVDKIHMQTQQNARKMLRRYRELRFLASSYGFEHMAAADQDIYHKGQKLEAYLEQPFLITVAFTNKEGVYTPLQETLKEVQQLLNS